MGHFTYAENADMHYMYGRANDNSSAALRIECITRSFLIDECRFTEFFSYIVNFETRPFHVTIHDPGR
ncbi:hypothetical protein TNCV_1322211 [Trichonephila clavipes]|nr:hypothetical protein TNCV_1322211 [Trichonephila clavipes]